MKPSDALDIIEALPSKYGVVRDQYCGEDAKRFVLIFQDDPENWSVRWAIGKTLDHFKWVKVVGQDGAWEPIDTSLVYSIPDERIKQDVALYFLKGLLISPAEYANILRGEKIILLLGIENRDLYNRAQKFYRSQPSFLRHQVERAHAIVKNLLKEMEKRGEVFSAVICSGDLPDLVSEELERRGISYAVIRPKMSHPSDRKIYKDVLRGKLPSDEEILSDTGVSAEAPPEVEEFPDKKKEEMKEKARVGLIRLIKSGNILPKLEPLLPSLRYESIARIVNSTDYGPKTKAVLVKADLRSLLEMQKTQLSIAIFKYKINNILRLVGIVGFVAALTGALFGIGVQPWYLKSVVALFGVASLGKFVTKRFADACGWSLLLLGFLGGYYFWGRWGMLLGIMMAGLVWRLVIPKQKIPPKEYRLLKPWKEIEKILVGTSEASELAKLLDVIEQLKEGKVYYNK